MVPTSTLASIIPLFIAVLAFIIVMLLPAIIELKKPKDAGPRIILEDMLSLQILSVSPEIPLLDFDDEVELNQKIIERMAKVLAILPKLEV
ncbi:MAG: hypothetical protein QXM52_07535 [Candidatus Bathyarchaeia archaeon]